MKKKKEHISNSLTQKTLDKTDKGEDLHFAKNIKKLSEKLKND